MTIEEEIRDADDAFMSASTPKTVNGQELEPFSLMRQSVALEIAGLDVETAFYEAVIRVWLCTLKPREVIAARKDKTQAVIDAFDWAEKSGFSFSNWQPLRDLYQQISNEIRESSNAAPENTATSSKTSGGPPAS